MAQHDKPSLAAAMWPSLASNSPEAQAKEAATAKQQAEVRERSKRLAADIRAMRTNMRAERGRGRR
jgi:hypothetical protein